MFTLFAILNASPNTGGNAMAAIPTALPSGFPIAIPTDLTGLQSQLNGPTLDGLQNQNLTQLASQIQSDGNVTNSLDDSPTTNQKAIANANSTSGARFFGATALFLTAAQF